MLTVMLVGFRLRREFLLRIFRQTDSVLQEIAAEHLLMQLAAVQVQGQWLGRRICVY